MSFLLYISQLKVDLLTFSWDLEYLIESLAIFGSFQPT